MRSDGKADKKEDIANHWADLNQSRPEFISELAYYRYVAQRLRERKAKRNIRTL